MTACTLIALSVRMKPEDFFGFQRISGGAINSSCRVLMFYIMEIFIMNTFDKIYEAVCRIPEGKVATYGMIAAMTGNPRRARVVGYALHSNPMPGVIPCHRVVNREGKTAPAFAFGGEDRQRELLEREGVRFLPDGRVDMEKYLWRG